MKSQSFIGLAALAVALNAGLAAAYTASQSEHCVVNKVDSRYSRFDYRQGEVIVKFRTSSSMKLSRKNGRVSSSSSSVNYILEKYGAVEASPLMPLSGSRVSAVKAKGFNGKAVADNDLSSLYSMRFDPKSTADIQTVISELEELAEVEYAEPNYVVHTLATGDTETYSADPLYSQQWGIPAIGLDKLWEAEAITDKRPVIAILDTGVDTEHPDLKDNIWSNTMELDGAEERDDDRNGFVDDVHGWDFVNNTAAVRDNNGHGTHCAGIAAAIGGNGVGIVGANPNALIMPLTVLQSNGSGDIGTIIRGIDYARANGADVLSMSFGTYANSQALRDALAKAYQSAVLVAAAGNDQKMINSSTMFPAAYNFVFGVEASDKDGSLANYSNTDDDGATYTAFGSDDLFNYELRAPGTQIMSTFPNGQYRVLNGTSMACPLVAGAISRLISVKDCSNREQLFGDMIHTSKGNVDIYAAYGLEDSNRQPTLTMLSYRLDDEKMGDGDGRADAGETIRIYPTFRNTWGNARNIRYSISLAEGEDSDIVEFLDFDLGETHVISNLSSYASVEAEAPFLLKVNSDCADGRDINLVLTATCDNISTPLTQPISLTVENGVEIGGIIGEDMTLTADKNYIVTRRLALLEGVTLTIEPGTKIKFREGGISVVDRTNNQKLVASKDTIVDGQKITIDVRDQYDASSRVIAKGTPEKRIVFDGGYFDLGHNSQLEYCTFVNGGSISMNINEHAEDYEWYFNCYRTGMYFMDASLYVILIDGNATMRDCELKTSLYPSGMRTSNFCNNGPGLGALLGGNFNNIVGNHNHQLPFIMSNELISKGFPNNIYSNSNYDVSSYDGLGSFYIESSSPTIIKPDKEVAPYLGTSNLDIAKRNVFDIEDNYGLAQYDFSTMRTRPYAEAHGIVWKVVVDDYDSQDEYELMPPLGVGRHKFEVYFNRRMNHDKTPMVAMGVAEPYTQTAIAADGEWRTETFDNDEVDVYTVYLDIQGKDNFDGVNTIYVAEAEDDEYFQIPVENIRFHVNVQSAGSLSDGFSAEPGLGKVTLQWENPEENFDDMLGYNMYRYEINDDESETAHVRINPTLLTEETMTDFDVVPGRRYCYYYKVMRTDLQESAASKIVAATPLTATKGDADGSMSVDVSDVVTEVNYMTGANPQPFIFEAADVNSDNEVDILDVVGTVNIIMRPEASSLVSAMGEQSATFSIENGILYLDSPVELTGLQFRFIAPSDTKITPLDALAGMETTTGRVNDNECLFLAFSLSGKTLPSGRHAILSIDDAEVSEVILSDREGHKVLAVGNSYSGVEMLVKAQMKVAAPNPFHDYLDVPMTIGEEGMHNVRLTLTGLDGSLHIMKELSLGYGEHSVRLETSGIANGFYLLTMTQDGTTVNTTKVIKK